MWELDYKESSVPKHWCFWTVVLEKTLESHLDCKEIQPVHPKGDQSCMFIGRTDAEAETLILWRRVDSLEKTLTLGKIEGDDRGWDGWMASTTRWTWVWARSGSWWWTGKPGMLQSVGLQKVVHDWVTELKHWTEHLSKHRMSHAIPINNKYCLPSSHQLLPYPRMCAQRTIMDKGKQNTGARS